MPQTKLSRCESESKNAAPKSWWSNLASLRERARFEIKPAHFLTLSCSTLTSSHCLFGQAAALLNLFTLGCLWSRLLSHESRDSRLESRQSAVGFREDKLPPPFLRRRRNGESKEQQPLDSSRNQVVNSSSFFSLSLPLSLYFRQRDNAKLLPAASFCSLQPKPC